MNNTGNLEHATYDSDETEPYYQSISDDTELYYQSDSPILKGQTVSDSELTEIYELPMDSKSKANKIGNKRQHINEKCNKGKRKSNSGKNKLGCKKQLFKCKTKNCMMILKSRKDLYQHHKSTHKGLHKCKNCKKKKYRTPYSLNQHNYIHKNTGHLLTCIQCKMTLAFKSQLVIHKSRHTKYGKYECSE